MTDYQTNQNRPFLRILEQNAIFMLQNMFFKEKHGWKKKGKERTTNEGGNGKGKEIGMHPYPLKETGVPKKRHARNTLAIMPKTI